MTKAPAAVQVRAIRYGPDKLDEKTLEPGEPPSVEGGPGVSWIDVEGLDKTTVEAFGKAFGLHPLVIDDILNDRQRPKFENFGDYIYIVLKMIWFDEEKEKITTEHVSLVLCERSVLTFQQGLEGDVFGGVRRNLRGGSRKLRGGGGDFLVYSMLDAVVDSYFTVLDRLSEKVVGLEEDVTADPRPKTLRTIHRLRRETIMLRRSIWPVRDILASMRRDESPLIKEATEVYLRDVYDHTVQLIETVETCRDLLAGEMDLYLSVLSYKTNAVMKVLTIIATVFIPLTFIAGIYGMNFKHMPELEWRWGYPFSLALMAATAFALMAFFRRRKFL